MGSEQWGQPACKRPSVGRILIVGREERSPLTEHRAGDSGRGWDVQGPVGLYDRVMEM